MNATRYCVGGTVGPEEVYVVRDADKSAQEAIRKRKYVLLCAPRQQGKSSLLARLISGLAAIPGHLVCPIDLEEFSKGTEATWYQDLFKALSGIVSEVVGLRKFEGWPTTYQGFGDLLRGLEETLGHKSLFMDIIIDEVPGCMELWMAQFFAAIRAHHGRTAAKSPRRVTFLFAGAFVPSDLISGSTSPFNVATPIPLLDFRETQVLDLVALGPWPAEQRTMLAREIHYWTGGQPYMTLWFCEHLAQKLGPWQASTVEEIARTFLLQEGIHLPSLRRRLEDEPFALVEVEKIAAAGCVPYVTSNLHHRLELLFGLITPAFGLFKPAEGSWGIRNRVYREYFSPPRQTLPSALPVPPATLPPSVSTYPGSSTSSTTGPVPPPQVFISYSHKDREEEMHGPVRPIHQFEVFWKSLEKAGYATTWIDHERVRAGRFEPQILEAIRTSRMAVLLVSPDYLASDFVAQTEIPELLAAEREGTLEILVVELAHCTVDHGQLKDYHRFNKGSPFQGLPDVNVLNFRLKELCDSILNSLAALA